MFMFFLGARAALIAVIAVTASSLCWSADDLTLGEAQHIAVQRSQLLVAQTASVRAARELSIAARQLPDPVLKFGVDNLPADGPDRGSLTRDFMTMRRIGISQEITSSEKRLLRSERFERDVGRMNAQRGMLEAALQRDTALAWIERFYAQTIQQRLLTAVEETRLQSQATETAYAVGRGSQSDVFAARSAVISMQDRVIQTESQSRNAATQLARWVGVDAAEKPLSGSPDWKSLPLQSHFDVAALSRHPDLLAMRAEVDAAENDAKLSQANKRSDWSVEASYSQRGAAYSNMVSIGVSIPLQWDQANRQDRDLAAKLALVQEAQARYEDLLRSREADVRGLLNDWQTGKERIERYQSELVPLARQRTEAALTSYKTGKSDLTSALGARREELDLQVQVLMLELQTARSWAQLNFLTPGFGTTAQSKDVQ